MYNYDRTAGASAADIRSIKDSLKQIEKTLKSMDDYLYEDATPAGLARALGVLTTAERLMDGLRTKLKKHAE